MDPSFASYLDPLLKYTNHYALCVPYNTINALFIYLLYVVMSGLCLYMLVSMVHYFRNKNVIIKLE